MDRTRWQDLTNAVIGVWLIASPIVLHFSDYSVSTQNTLLVGIVITLLAVEALKIPEAWEEVINVIFGGWLAISPWVPGFDGPPAAMYNSAMAGSLIIALALWAMFRDRGVREWWHNWHPHA